MEAKYNNEESWYQWCQNAGEAYAILCKNGMRFPGINPGTALSHAIYRTQLFQRWLKKYVSLTGKMPKEEKEIVMSVVTADISDFPEKIDDLGQCKILYGFWSRDLKLNGRQRKKDRD